MAKAPCRNCQRRKLLCHSACAEYQAFKAQVEEEQKARQAENDKHKPLPREARYALNRQSRKRRNRGV